MFEAVELGHEDELHGSDMAVWLTRVQTLVNMSVRQELITSTTYLRPEVTAGHKRQFVICSVISKGALQTHSSDTASITGEHGQHWH